MRSVQVQSGFFRLNSASKVLVLEPEEEAGEAEWEAAAALRGFLLQEMAARGLRLTQLKEEEQEEGEQGEGSSSTHVFLILRRHEQHAR